MNCMATLKHIASKNSDYSAIEAYLIYQHDAFTGKQLLDEQGKPKLRDSYLLDTLECGDFSFAAACLLANRKYGKNTQHGDIKSHQYIISFDPRDAADNGLTIEKAQALGLKFCEENFPGHPAIVCTAAGQPPRQKKFETVKVACRGEAPPFAAQTARSLKSPTGAFVASQTRTLRKQISSVLYRTTSFEEFSDRLMQQYGITVKESRGRLSYLPAGRTKFIRAKHLGDKFDKVAVLATLQANAERKPKAQFKQDTIGKLIDIQVKLAEGKGTGYERWAKKYNLKAMSQTLILLQEKDLLNEDDLNQRIAELETKYHDALAVVKDLEGRMKTNKELRYHVAAYASTKSVAQQLKAAKRPAAFEEQHRAELTAHRAAAAYFKANDITKLPSPKKLEAEYTQLASEKAKFYEQYKEAKSELLKLKTAKQNVASFFREEEPAQQER